MIQSTPVLSTLRPPAPPTICPRCESPLQSLCRGWFACPGCRVNWSTEELEEAARALQDDKPEHPLAGWFRCWWEDVHCRSVALGGGSRSKGNRKKPTRRPYDPHDDPADRNPAAQNKREFPFVVQQRERELRENDGMQIDPSTGKGRRGAPEAIQPKDTDLKVSLPTDLLELLKDAAAAVGMSLAAALEALVYGTTVTPLLS